MVRRFLKCTLGAAAAEMALIVPLAVLILFTTLEAGHWMYVQHQVMKGVRDGARYAARQSFDIMDCGGSITDGAILNNVKELTRTGELSGGSPRVSGWNAANVEVTIDCTGIDTTVVDDGIYDTDTPARTVIVSAKDLTYNSLFNGLGVITDSVNLVGEQRAAVMGI